MMTFLMKKVADSFERRYDYDAGYMRELAEADPGGVFRLGLVSAFATHRFGLPAKVFFAAKATATRKADCGSCLRLVIAMAEEAGVPHRAMLDLLLGEQPDPDMDLAAKFAQAVLDDSPELMELIEAAKKRWGERGVAGLAGATASGLFYPILKRGIGHGNRCEPVIARLKAETAMEEERMEFDAARG